MITKLVQRASVTAARVPAPERAGLLMAANAPYHARLEREIRKVPFSTILFAGTASTVHTAAAALPMHIAEQFVAPRAFGPAATPEQRRTRRRAALGGSLAAVAVGVLAQRSVNHSGEQGQISTEIARMFAKEMAIGGAAGAIVLSTDGLLGEWGRAKLNSPTRALTAGALLAAGQSRALRRAAAVVSLPADPYPRHRPR